MTGRSLSKADTQLPDADLEKSQFGQIIADLTQDICGDHNHPIPTIKVNQTSECSSKSSLQFSSTNTDRIQPLLRGTKWAHSVVTYSFYSGQLSGSYYGPETGVAEVSNAIKANIRFIIEHYIEPYINIDLIEVKDDVNRYGDIRYMFSNNPPHAYGYYPSASALGGDVHLNRRFNHADSTNGFKRGQGSYGFSVLLHETLHALGLKHPGNYNGDSTSTGPFLPGDEDNTTNTIMSYNVASHSPATMMPYDILALQSLYGKGTLNEGATTYVFDTVHSFTDGQQYWGNGTQPMKLALWDAGGNDSLDLSKLTTQRGGYHFDISQGGILTHQSAYNTSIYNPLNSSVASARTSSYGTAIAFETQIENLIATSSPDKILGNNADNSLFGQGHHDQLWGYGGNDVLNGGIGNDQVEGGKGQDTLLGMKGDDTLLGNSGKDSIIGGKGNDHLLGGSGNDTLEGNAGSDVLNGGRGTDSLTGGAGRDQFLLSQGKGMAIITDFSRHNDKLILPAEVNFKSLRISNQNGDAHIQIGSDVMAVLTGINVNQIASTHFQ